MAGFDTSVLKELMKVTGNEFAGLASDEEKFNTLGWIDTGSYALNALLSGSIYKGAPDNKVVGFSGEEATGKTFFTIACMKHFLDADPNAIVALFETESSVDSNTIKSRGIDPNRVAIFPVGTIQEFRHQVLNLVDKLISKGEKRPKILIVLDSLAMLSSDAEVKKAEEGTDTKDFTLFQVSKATFRVLTLKLGKNRIPMYLTTHTYANLGGYGETSKVAGGCLAAGTNVVTQSGFAGIETILVGDFVLTKEGEFCEVTDKFYYADKPTLKIKFEDGYEVECTPEHKFFVNGEWVEAKSLIIGTDVEALS